MGFHICEYCVKEGTPLKATSSGDVTLSFQGGNSWQMPDMILHYVKVHKWKPPEDFIHDIMFGELASLHRRQTRSVQERRDVGYLSGPLETGDVPERFVAKLADAMEKAKQMGQREQTKGDLSLFRRR